MSEDFLRFAAAHPSSQPVRQFAVGQHLTVLTDDGPDIAALAGLLDELANNWMTPAAADVHPYWDHNCLATVHLMAMVMTDDRCPSDASHVLSDALFFVCRAYTPTDFAVALIDCAAELAAIGIAEHDDAVHRLTGADR